MQAETDEQLFKEGLVSELNLKKSKANADALANEVLLEKQRVDTLAKSNQRRSLRLKPASSS